MSEQSSINSAHLAVADAGAPSEQSSQRERGGERQSFERDELAVVLSHYDLGVIEGVQDFKRGSRRAPKLLVRARNAAYLLKRRASGQNDPYKVAFSHALQLYLARRDFPLPHLVGTRESHNSMLQWGGQTYEMFQYIQGEGYDQSLEATHDAGKTLGLFHRLAGDFQSEYACARGSYHGAKSVASATRKISREFAERTGGAAEDAHRIEQLSQSLNSEYEQAGQRVEEAGMSKWPTQIVHSDWHPGNLLFQKSRVAAVMDFDAARIQQRVLDVANGGLQFSLTGGGDDTQQWPDYPDFSRLKRFLTAYDQVNMLSKAELQVLPWLMIEALIAESVIPIAATGMFGQLEGSEFLVMIERKVGWLRKHADKLGDILS